MHLGDTHTKKHVQILVHNWYTPMYIPYVKCVWVCVYIYICMSILHIYIYIYTHYIYIMCVHMYIYTHIIYIYNVCTYVYIYIYGVIILEETAWGVTAAVVLQAKPGPTCRPHAGLV